MRERRHDAAQGAGDEASHEARWNGTAQNGSSYANGNGEQTFGWDDLRRKDINCSFDTGSEMVEAPQDADLKLETGRFLNNSLADIVSAACFCSPIYVERPSMLFYSSRSIVTASKFPLLAHCFFLTLSLIHFPIRYTPYKSLTSSGIGSRNHPSISLTFSKVPFTTKSSVAGH